MKKGLFTFFTCLLIIANALGQDDETLFNRFNFRLTGAWGGTIAGISKVGDNSSPTAGGYGVLEFDKQFLVGWGGFRINDNVEFDGIDFDYDLDYNGLIIGYSPQAFRAVHPHVMALIGSGDMQLIRREDDIRVRDRTPVLQLGGGAELNVFQWFRISANGGYRFLLDADGLPTSIAPGDVSGLYGELNFKFGWSWGKR